MPDRARILVVDDERSVREMISILLTRDGHTVSTAHSGARAIELLEAGERFHLVITDLAMDRGGGMEVLAAIKGRDPLCPVILVTAFGTTSSAVEAMKAGAHDYIAKPFNVDEFRLIVASALEHRRLLRENEDLKARVRGEFRFLDVVGRSRRMREIISLCRKVADSTATVLISGESGTGKEVMARAIHFGGPRSAGPFVAINCGALPEQLMESELFGHARGSFTGATEDKAGLFEVANGGTVFLDEIGDLPAPLQVKLLRVLQERVMRRVGAAEEIEVDARIISATNQDLERLVADGRFRTDLFYRLNVIRIEMPPLRERREDIPDLVEALLPQVTSQVGKEALEFSPQAIKALIEHDFPGNVRELKNILERAVTLASGKIIERADLPFDSTGKVSETTHASRRLPEGGVALDSVLEEFERDLIRQAMERTGGAQKPAAELLGITVRSLRYRLDKLGMDSSNESQ